VFPSDAWGQGWNLELSEELELDIQMRLFPETTFLSTLNLADIYICVGIYTHMLIFT